MTRQYSHGADVANSRALAWPLSLSPCWTSRLLRLSQDDGPVEAPQLDVGASTVDRPIDRSVDIDAVSIAFPFFRPGASSHLKIEVGEHVALVASQFQVRLDSRRQRDV